MYCFTALVVAALGVLPLAVRKRFGLAAIIGAISFLVGWWIFYGNSVSTVWPVFGLPGLWFGMTVSISAIFESTISGEEDGSFYSYGWVWIFPVGYIAAVISVAFTGSSIFNAGTYASLLGHVEERDWTRDVQPKDPRHMQMVSAENALYLAQKAVANAGAIGSQFELDWGSATLQKAPDGHLIYAIPFDFSGFSVWQSSAGVPAYIIVDAEDPERLPQLVKLSEGGCMHYTPGAFFGQNLERYLRMNGFMGEGLYQPRFEIDDKGQPRWVVSTYKPSVAWWGEKIDGVAVVDPVSGEISRYSLDQMPKWVERVFPGGLIGDYIDQRGEYSGGWWNSWWGKKDLTTSEMPVLVCGADDRLQWVTGVTSTNSADDSLIGLMYTDARTGRSVYYRTDGGATDTAIISSVDANQQVKYKHLHATTPQTYNVYGVMTSVVPLANDNHAYQGVALLRIANPQDVAVGNTQLEAFMAYQSLVYQSGQQIALPGTHVSMKLTGTIDRIRQDVSGNGSTYLFHLAGVPRIFTVSSGEYVKITLTQSGDKVAVRYIASGEDTVPVQGFDNLSLPLDKTVQEGQVEAAEATKVKKEEAKIASTDIILKIKSMSPDEIQRLDQTIKGN
ncbi:MAG: hypothetical protein KGI79_02095 [Patescibacteria group bacterium]|nr:hypothetical protein [Patescibacteria group bacterium]MDE2116642.1 hypothetical protein [Patescibacteria group bacterium]